MKVRFGIAFLLSAGAAVLLPVGVAHADTTCPAPAGSCSPPSAEVLPASGFVQPAVMGESGAKVVSPAVAAAPVQQASLPLTGGDVAGLTAIGLVLVGGGGVLVRRTRTRSAD